jgi:hypothetical protein
LTTDETEGSPVRVTPAGIRNLGRKVGCLL